jgi:hypothetical protein
MMFLCPASGHLTSRFASLSNITRIAMNVLYACVRSVVGVAARWGSLASTGSAGNDGICSLKTHSFCPCDDNISRHNSGEQVWIFVADRWTESPVLSLPAAYLLTPLLLYLTGHSAEALGSNSLSTCLREEINTLHWHITLKQLFPASSGAEAMGSEWLDTLRMGEWGTGSVVVKALCFKLEGRGFDTRWSEFLNLLNSSGRTKPWGSLSL